MVRTCSTCGDVVVKYLIHETPWQQGDTDSRDLSTDELIAGGATVECWPCVEERQANEAVAR